MATSLVYRSIWPWFVALATFPLTVGACTGEQAHEASEDDVEAAAARALAGVYVDGQGVFTELTLTRTLVRGRFLNEFFANKRPKCVRAPCATASVSGKWSATSSRLTLIPVGDVRTEYRYTRTSTGLSLRDGSGEWAQLTKRSSTAGPAAAALTEFAIPLVRVSISDSDIRTQEALDNQRVTFESALRSALRSFLNDDGAETPVALVRDVPPSNLPEGCRHLAARPRLACVVNRPRTTLGMLKVGSSAEHGETVERNWIFTLSIPELSDHGHWAIVDREGREATYNYGFN